ncbi:hypothetical protein [Sphingobacterium thalpophilum]|uniref:hypothetical protein n=1 Tax=Sphingobacterium thalpophilum TaxID=259 RepID=UPI003D9A093C
MYVLAGLCSSHIAWAKDNGPNDKGVVFYLHPDNPNGFAGEGAARNLVWRLRGQRPLPLSGHYGGMVTADRFPGVDLETKEVVYRVVPQGPLIDGAVGESITRKAADGHQFDNCFMLEYTK